MYTSRPANTHISKEVIVIDNSLQEHRVPTFPIIIISVVHCRRWNWNMAAINGPSTLDQTPPFSLNPSTTLESSTPYGKCIYVFRSTSTIALQVSQTITHTIHLATPNKCAIVRYSPQVARYQRVIATCWSTHIARLSFVFCHCIYGVSHSHNT